MVKMKSRIISVAAALLILGAATVHAADQSSSGNANAQKTAESATTAAPEAQFPERGFTFEAVVDGTTVSHEFPVKNTGKGPLAIRKVKTG
jgi:hypothetical protein